MPLPFEIPARARHWRNASQAGLAQAAKTPGEVAQTILIVTWYILGLGLLVVLGGERVTKMEGLF